MSETTGSTGAWHPDPLGRYAQRWWDGQAWTDQVIDAGGVTSTDPLGIAESPDETVVASGGTGFESPGGGAVPPPPAGFPAPTGFPASTGFPAASAPMPGATPVAPASSSTSNAVAIIAVVLGAGSLLVSLIPFFGWFALPFALGAIGCGIAGLSKAKTTGGGKGLSMAGLATGALSIFVMIVMTIVFVVWVGDSVDDLDVNSDPADGVCDADRWLQDPDCGSNNSDDDVNSDPVDGVCNEDRWLQDPDC